MIVVSFVVAQFASLGVVIIVPLLVHMTKGHAKVWVNSTLGQFVYVVLAEGLTLLILWFFLRKRGGFRAAGFTRKPRLSDPIWAVLVGIAYYILLVVATVVVGLFTYIQVDQKQDIGFTVVITNLDKMLTFVSLVVLPPLVEETLFRGVLFGGLRKRLPFVWSTLIVSALFAIPHLLEGDGKLLWIGGLDTFILSLGLCTLRERTGSLWSGVFLHMLKNGVAYLYLFIFVSK